MTNDERYYKLRWLMSGNAPETWKQVENAAAVACYVSWDEFDQYLESIPTEPYEKFMCGGYNYEEFK